jgi:hypothetical protein
MNEEEERLCGCHERDNRQFDCINDTSTAWRLYDWDIGRQKYKHERGRHRNRINEIKGNLV